MAEAAATTRGLPAGAEGTVVTVGTFDGVHVGHRDLLHRLAARAAQRRTASVLVTFEPHPLEIVNPVLAPPLLTPGIEKLAAVADTGVHHAVVLPFTRALAALPAAAFVEQILLERLAMRELLIGYDHGLGRGREGDAAALRALGQRHGFTVQVVDAVQVDGEPVSSTRVRRALAAGDLSAAARLLGRRFAFDGTVVAGEGRGRALGYPTLNVQLRDARKLLPPGGVYAVLAETPRGSFGGMMNLGPRPTFGEETTTLEVHLFDVGGDWYGLAVRVQFVARLRDTVKFASADALVAQLARDAEHARFALTQLVARDTVKGSSSIPTSFL